MSRNSISKWSQLCSSPIAQQGFQVIARERNEDFMPGPS